MTKFTPSRIIQIVLGVLGALSGIVTVGVSVYQPEHRPIVVFCIGVVLFCGVLFGIQWFFWERISSAEARRNRHFLMEATDSQASSWSRRRTAIGSYAIEVHVTEDFLAILISIKDRLQHYREDASEEVEFSEKAVKQLRSKVVEIESDRLFIETNHAAFNLLLKRSGRANRWAEVKRDLQAIGKEIQAEVEPPMADGLRRVSSEDGEAKETRRKQAVKGSYLATERLLQKRVNPLVIFVQALREEARADLLKQL